MRARIVLDSLRWLSNANRFVTDAAVVMPDHVHFAGALGNETLASIMHSCKSYTANRLVMTNLRAPVWQDGYHDHGLRDDEDYRSRVRYLLDNPVRAGLVGRTADYPYLILPVWWWSDDPEFR